LREISGDRPSQNSVARNREATEDLIAEPAHFVRPHSKLCGLSILLLAALIIALFPLALNIGSGAELQRPLAIAVIGGLSVSTLFTLVVIPVAHLLVDEPEHRSQNRIGEDKSC